MSVLTTKSWKDIRRRWARSLFTILTVAAAVSSLSLFGVMTLVDRAMDERVVEDRLHDIQLHTEDLALTSSELEALGSIAGVSAIDARTLYPTRVRIGDRRIDVLLLGVRDFEAQSVDAIQLDDGAFPVQAQALTERQNARAGRLSVNAGSAVSVEDNLGGLHAISISGAGATLQYTLIASELAVLYAPQALVNEIAGTRGVNTIDFRVVDPADAAPVLERLRAWFEANRPDTTFTDLPEVREAGTWPGQDVFENFTTLFYVGGVLALLSSIALVSNTMTTMVAEQRREIAIMKAIGGRRPQIIGSFMRTVWILAFIGTVVGVLLGIPFSNLLAGFAGRQFLGVNPGWGYSTPVILFSFVVGVGGATLAAIPALLRAARLPIREGLSSGIAATPGSRIDRLIRRARLPRTTQVGLRNITRRKTRTLGTVIQVGLAVGVALGFIALGVTVSTETARNWDALHWDVVVSQHSNVGFSDGTIATIEAMDGVGPGHPLLYNAVEIDGTQYEAWGLPPTSTLYEPDLKSGRWFTEADADARVVILGPALATTTGLRPGDTATITTATGPAQFTVIGVDGRIVNNGTVVLIPLSAFRTVLGRHDTNAYWLVSESKTHADIDRLAAAVEDTLGAAGAPASTEIHYVERNANLASNRVLVGLLAVMSVPVVAIGLIGLVNLMTMNVLERTREIGILRCIGARSKDITGIFRTEALTIAVLGWLLAVPIGWLTGWVMVWIVGELFKFGNVPYSFPVLYPPLALVVTMALAWLVILAPLRRASHLRPGDALRHE